MKKGGYALVPGLTGTSAPIAAQSSEDVTTVYFNAKDKIRGIELSGISYFDLFDAEKVEQLLWDTVETLQEDEICFKARLIGGGEVIMKVNCYGDIIKLSGPEVCNMPEVNCIIDIPLHLCKKFMEGLFDILEIK